MKYNAFLSTTNIIIYSTYLTQLCPRVGHVLSAILTDGRRRHPESMHHDEGGEGQEQGRGKLQVGETQGDNGGIECGRVQGKGFEGIVGSKKREYSNYLEDQIRGGIPVTMWVYRRRLESRKREWLGPSTKFHQFSTPERSS